MKNMTKLFGIITLVVVITVSLTGCKNPPRLVGVWELENVENGSSFGLVRTFELFRDGTGIAEGSTAVIWKVENNRIFFTLFGSTQVSDYILAGSKLTIILDSRTNHRAIYQKR